MINFMNKLLNALGIGVADNQVDDSFEPVSMETLKDRHSHLLRTQILMVGRQGVQFQPDRAGSSDAYSAGRDPGQFLSQVPPQKSKEKFMSMWGGYGSFGDFYITNATEGETEARNTEFDTVTGAILMFYQDD